MTPEQAKILYDQGDIDEETYRMVVPQPAIASIEPMASVEPVNPVDPVDPSKRESVGGDVFEAQRLIENDPRNPNRSQPPPDAGFPAPRDQLTQADVYAFDPVPDKSLGEYLEDPSVADSYKLSDDDELVDLNAQPDNMPSFDDYYEASGGGQAASSLRRAAELQRSAAQEYAAAEYESAMAAGRAQEQAANDRALLQIAKNKKIDQWISKNEEITDQIANHKIDPSRLWSNTSTGGKILAAMSMALGAFGASANGGENRAASIIRGAIKDDIALQEAELEKLQGMRSAHRSLLSDMMTIYDDKEQAVAAAELGALKKVRSELAAEAARYKGKTAQVEFMKTDAQLRQAEDDARKRFATLATLQAGGGVSDPMKMQNAVDVLVKDPSLKKKAYEEISTIQNARRGIQRIEQEFAKVGNGFAIPMTGKEAYIKGLNARIFAHVKTAMGERFTDKDVEELVQPFQLTYKDITSGRVNAKLSQIKSLIRDRMNTPTLNRLGIYRGDEDSIDALANKHGWKKVR